MKNSLAQTPTELKNRFADKPIGTMLEELGGAFAEGAGDVFKSPATSTMAVLAFFVGWYFMGFKNTLAVGLGGMFASGLFQRGKDLWDSSESADAVKVNQDLDQAVSTQQQDAYINTIYKNEAKEVADYGKRFDKNIFADIQQYLKDKKGSLPDAEKKLIDTDPNARKAVEMQVNDIAPKLDQKIDLAFDGDASKKNKILKKLTLEQARQLVLLDEKDGRQMAINILNSLIEKEKDPVVKAQLEAQKAALEKGIESDDGSYVHWLYIVLAAITSWKIFGVMKAAYVAKGKYNTAKGVSDSFMDRIR